MFDAHCKAQLCLTQLVERHGFEFTGQNPVIVKSRQSGGKTYVRIQVIDSRYFQVERQIFTSKGFLVSRTCDKVEYEEIFDFLKFF